MDKPHGEKQMVELEKKTTYQIIKIADVLNGNAVLNLKGQAQIDFLREVNNKEWVSVESLKESWFKVKKHLCQGSDCEICNLCHDFGKEFEGLKE